MFKNNTTITSFIDLRVFYGVKWLGVDDNYSRSAFGGCTNLATIGLPIGLTGIGYQNFQSCSKLSAITIPNTVTTISRQAFKDCTSYRNIIIPDSVKSLGTGAFEGTLANKVTIGTGVTSINNYAFTKWNRSIPVFIIKATTPPSIPTVGIFYNNNTYFPSAIYVPDNSVNAYKTSWSAYAEVIKPMSEYTGEIPATNY